MSLTHWRLETISGQTILELLEHKDVARMYAPTIMMYTHIRKAALTALFCIIRPGNSPQTARGNQSRSVHPQDGRRKYWVTDDLSLTIWQLADRAERYWRIEANPLYTQVATA